MSTWFAIETYLNSKLDQEAPDSRREFCCANRFLQQAPICKRNHPAKVSSSEQGREAQALSMEGRSGKPKSVAVKPIHKAGLPSALSPSSFTCTRVLSRNHSFSKALSEREEKKDSSGEASAECKIKGVKQVSEQELVSVIRKIEQTQIRLAELEAIFLQCCTSKDQESLLLQHELKLEHAMSSIDALTMELSSSEAEIRTVVEMGALVQSALEMAEFLKAENGYLRKKARKLSSKLRRLKHKQSPIKGCNRIKQRKNRIRALEGENQRLLATLSQLKSEKSEFQNNLELAERSIPPVSESIEDLGKKMELRELQWSDACLRYMVEKNQENKESSLQMKTQLQLCVKVNKKNDDGFKNHAGNASPTITSRSHGSSKAKKLFTTMAKWVSRSDSRCKVKKVEGDCYGYQVVPECSPVRTGHRRSI